MVSCSHSTQIGGQENGGKGWNEMECIPSCSISLHPLFINPNTGTKTYFISLRSIPSHSINPNSLLMEWNEMV